MLPTATCLAEMVHYVKLTNHQIYFIFCFKLWNGETQHLRSAKKPSHFISGRTSKLENFLMEVWRCCCVL